MKVTICSRWLEDRIQVWTFCFVCIVAEKCQDAAGGEFPQSQWPILCHSSSSCYHLCKTIRFVSCNDAGLLVTWLLFVFALTIHLSFCGTGAWSRDLWDLHAIMAAGQYIYAHNEKAASDVHNDAWGEWNIPAETLAKYFETSVEVAFSSPVM